MWRLCFSPPSLASSGVHVVGCLHALSLVAVVLALAVRRSAASLRIHVYKMRFQRDVGRFLSGQSGIVYGEVPPITLGTSPHPALSAGDSFATAAAVIAA